MYLDIVMEVIQMKEDVLVPVLKEQSVQVFNVVFLDYQD